MELTEAQIKLINIFSDHYRPLEDPNSKTREFLSAPELFVRMQSLWPSEDYTPYDVVLILQYLKIESVSGSKITYLVDFIS